MFEEQSRIAAALLLAAAAALAATLLGAPFEAAIVMLVLATAGILYVADPRLARSPAPEISKSNLPAPEPDLLLDAIGDPVLIVQGDRIERANEAAIDLLGDHIVGGDVRLALRHAAAVDPYNLASDEVGEVELEGLGGRDRHWAIRLSRRVGGRRVIHLVDRTASRAAERMRVDFVANASHELRTPLAAILGFVETLGDDEAGSDPATRARFLDIISVQTKRMKGLIEDLLSLSRIDADRHRPKRDLIDLAGLSREVAEIVAAELGAHGRIAVDAAEATPSVPGDRVQLSQLVHNLIENALKYGRPGTPVEVSVEAAGSAQVRLRVRDQGEGIAAEHIPRLTERFYRVDAGRSRSLGGTGLGLAIVKHVAERHGGRIEIASEVGSGTTVDVLLPAAPAALSQKSHVAVT